MTAEFGICVIGQTKYYETQKSFIRYIISTGRSFKLFTNGLPEDNRMAKNILAELNIPPNEYNLYLLPGATTEKELIQQVTSFRYIFSYRMHSLIIASSFGIPHFGFVGASKIRMFYHHLNADDRCCCINNHSDFDSILKISARPIDNIDFLVKEQANHSLSCLIHAISRNMR